MSSESVISFLNRVQNRLIDQQVKKGIKASGKSIASLRPSVQQTGSKTRGQLFGADYWQFLETGRGPSRGGGSGLTLQQRILEWMRFKPGFPADPKKREGISYAIAKTIHRKGTLAYRSNTAKRVQISKIIREERIALLDQVGKAQATLIRQKLQKDLRI